MGNHVMNQREFLRKYNDEHREKFNKELFERNDDKFIEYLEKAIISCERDTYFKLKVQNFEVVESYEKILNILREQESIKSESKDKSINKYDYIMLNDSAVKLLIVDWYIWVPNPKKEKDNTDPPHDKVVRVYILVPRYVDKYYLKLFGNIYSQKYQIVDGSTYNNSQKLNAKTRSVSLKSFFMATRLYRYRQQLTTTKGEVLQCVFYMSAIFSKMVPAIKYLLAKFGLYETMARLGVEYLRVDREDIDDDDYYTINTHNVFISIPKFIYDNDIVAQSLVYTVYNVVKTDEISVDDLYTVEFFTDSLGAEFNSKDPNKGKSVLCSLENIYDIPTKESIRLPESQKRDIYDILVWSIREFSELLQKDNLDTSAKRVRLEDYAAMLYVMKISGGLFRISDIGENIQISDIEKCIWTFPDYLIKVLVRDTLCNVIDTVNDLDSFTPLKCSYKGVSGIGENKSNSVSDEYRQVNPTQLGRIDLDASSANDPGLTGMICPMANLYDHYFSDFSEPNSWREEVKSMISEYKRVKGLKEIYTLQREIGIYVDPVKDAIAKENIDKLDMVMPFIISVDQSMISVSKVD